MRIQPPSTRRSLSPSNPHPPPSSRSFHSHLSSLWSSLTDSAPTDHLPSSPPSDIILLEKRKDKTITITNTDTSTVTESFTIHINQTVYTTLTTEVYYTHNITFYQPTTITHNQTFTSTEPLTVSVSVSVPTTTTATNSVISAPTTRTSTKATTSHLALDATAATSSASPIPVSTSPQHHTLSTPNILALVFGILGFLVLLAAVLWGVRGFLKKYRSERVQRKRLQMEVNELPVMRTGEGEKEGVGSGVFVVGE